MPHLSIIPAHAVADSELSDTQLRVLCAMGTFTNRLGGNVWASVATMAKACNLSPRTVQRALPKLLERGYLTKVERTGRTTVYDVVLQTGPLTEESPHPRHSSVTPPLTQLSHPNDERNEKKNDRAELRTVAQEVCNCIWSDYPKRDTPHLYPPALRAIMQCIEDGAEPKALVVAAGLYAQDVERKQIDPRYVKTIHKFYADGAWEHYKMEPRVHGRTRDEWARSGQDVAEFDRLAGAA
jgi:hypothetical protein